MARRSNLSNRTAKCLADEVFALVGLDRKGGTEDMIRRAYSLA
jgi:hypothetical protein